MTLIGNVTAGDFILPEKATLNLDGHALKVLNPAATYSKSILGTVNAGEGGRIVWTLTGLVIRLR